MLNEKAPKVNRVLIKKLKQRSQEAFATIYYDYKDLIYYYAFSILNNKEDSEDVVQETYIRLMNSIDNISDDSNIKALLVQIGKNIALDKYRSNSKQAIPVCDEMIENITSDSNSASNIVITLNNLLDVNEAKVAVLKIVYDYTFSEIAEEMNITIGAAQSTYYRAIKTLKKHYKERLWT